jgi:EmrB/QacA subfamily drug resistance transporter
VFVACSVLASTATSPTVLIVARGLMGIGAALIYPTTLSIITNTFEGAARARAIGFWAGVVGVGAAVGPLAGGLILEHFSWGAVFLVNVPTCLAAILLGIWVVPDSRDPDNRPLDPPGVVLSIVGMFGLVYAIIQVPTQGWSAPGVLVSFAVGVVFLGSFVAWELRSRHPMLDMRVFENPRFSAASGAITVTFFALAGSSFLTTQYFQLVLGYSPLKAGFITLPSAIGIMVMAPNSHRLVARWGTKRTVMTGLLVTATGILGYSSNTLMSSVAPGCMLLVGIGMGMATAPATDSIMGSLPPARAGVGSAVNDTTRQTGGAFGVAILGSIFLAAYRHAAAPIAGVSPSAKKAIHESIGSALRAAAGAVTPAAHRIEDAAHQAFLQAMRVTFPIAAFLIFGAALLAWRFLPTHASNEVDVATGDAAPVVRGRTAPEPLPAFVADDLARESR